MPETTEEIDDAVKPDVRLGEKPPTFRAAATVSDIVKKYSSVALNSLGKYHNSREMESGGAETALCALRRIG